MKCEFYQFLFLELVLHIPFWAFVGLILLEGVFIFIFIFRLFQL